MQNIIEKALFCEKNTKTFDFIKNTWYFIFVMNRILFFIPIISFCFQPVFANPRDCSKFYDEIAKSLNVSQTKNINYQKNSNNISTNTASEITNDAQNTTTTTSDIAANGKPLSNTKPKSIAKKILEKIKNIFTPRPPPPPYIPKLLTFNKTLKEIEGITENIETLRIENTQETWADLGLTIETNNFTVNQEFIDSETGKDGLARNKTDRDITIAEFTLTDAVKKDESDYFYRGMTLEKIKLLKKILKEGLKANPNKREPVMSPEYSGIVDIMDQPGMQCFAKSAHMAAGYSFGIETNSFVLLFKVQSEGSGITLRGFRDKVYVTEKSFTPEKFTAFIYHPEVGKFVEIRLDGENFILGPKTE